MENDYAISVRRALRLLRRALPAIVTGDVGALGLFTDDVSGDAPDLRVRSRAELECQLIDRAGALSRIELAITRLEPWEGGFTATWRLSGIHTGAMLINEDELFEPSGRRIELAAKTCVRFRDRRICAFEMIYEGQDLVDQIRLRPRRSRMGGSEDDEP
jgi:hypothetical protein